MKIICTVILALVTTCSYAKDEHSVLQPDALQKLQNSRVTFTRNAGQIDTYGKADCRFTTSVGGANYFFCADGVVADYVARLAKSRTDSGDLTSRATVTGHVLKLNFLARTNFLAEVRGQDEQEYKCNYFIGNDASKWHTNVPNYSRIVYNDVWEGIDVVYRSASCQLANAISRRDLTSRATLEYDVIVHPGANPNQIQFAYEGQDALSIDSKGNLVLKTSVGDVIEQTPYVYQIIDGVKKEISSSFIIHNSSFSIQTGSYDPTRELIIDPVYSTYLGGDNNDFGMDVVADKAGNAYVTGYTFSSNFPVTTGSYQSPNRGSFDVFVTKFNATGSGILFSTIFGGGNSDMAYGVTVDDAENIYVTGSTLSTDFPVYPNPGAFQMKQADINNPASGSGGSKGDVFVTKLRRQGDSLVYSTYLGGTACEVGRDIAVDQFGNAFVVGYTQSPNYPATPGAFQPVNRSLDQSGVTMNEAFVTKINQNGTGLVYSTYLGGLYNDCAFGIVIDAQGYAYVTGQASDFPGISFPTTPGAYQEVVKGQQDIFVTKLKPNGDSLDYSTLIGGRNSVRGIDNESESGQGIAIDSDGNAYVTGYTNSTDFPVSPSAYQTQPGENGPGTGPVIWDAFVLKLNSSGSGLVYSTYLHGDNDNDMGHDIRVDAKGRAYVLGTTKSSNFPVTDGAFQKIKKSGDNNFLVVLDASGESLDYGTYLGTSTFYNNSISRGSTLDLFGNFYVVGSTKDTTFPTTPGSYMATQNDKKYENVFVAKFCLIPILAIADSVIVDTVRCAENQTTVSIQNLCVDVPLRIDTITLTGQNASNFSFIDPPKFPIIIGALGDTQFVLQLTRVGSAGTKTAFLNIHSNDDAPLADTLKQITLIGVVDSIGVQTLKKNVTFGKLYCDDVSFDTVIQVKNKGLQAATIVPTVAGDGATSFTVTPSSATIAGGGTTNFTVHFQPSGNGSFSAHLKFSDDACEMAFDTMYVAGSKVSTVSLSSNPPLIDFGEHCHSSVVDSFIIVHNTSNATVTLDPAVMSGSGFTVLAPTTSVTLGPDSSIKYRIRFTSSGVGNYQGRISMMGKPCNISVSNQLRGTEIEPPKITLSPKTVFFDTLDCSEAERFTKVKVKNVGGRTITLKPVIVGDTHSYHAQPESITIPKNSSFNVKIIFHPDNVGQHSAYLFFDDMLCGLLKDSVSVRGFKSSIGAISGKPVPLHFDTMNCSAGKRDTISLWLKNTGDQILNLNTPTVSGNKFIIENANGVLGLAPLDSIEYRIIFTPNGEGTYLDTFRITGTCGVLFTCPLSGVCDYNVDVKENSGGNAGEFFLGQNHPNPFSQSSVVSYQLSVGSRGIFEVRDMLGRVVSRTYVNKSSTQVTIYASALPNGLYLYSLSDGKNIQSRMMMVVH